MPDAIHLETLSDTDIVRERMRLLQIYEESFPPNQRDPFDSLVAPPRKSTLLGAYKAGTLVGFADVSPLGAREAFLRFMAVAEDERSKGAGTLILGAIDHCTQGSYDRIVFEVEDPATASNPDLAARRIRFYERWGARQVRCIDRYFYPNPLDESDRIEFLFFEKALGLTPRLHGESLRQTLEQIYREYYGDTATQLHLQVLLDRVIC